MGHAEFAYNKSPSVATKYSPIECVFGVNPLLPLSLIDLPKQEKVHPDARQQAEALLKVHKQVQENIIKANTRYKAQADKGRIDKRNLKIGDLVWVHLRKNRFPDQRKNKLMPKTVGPFKITEKKGTNALKVVTTVFFFK